MDAYILIGNPNTRKASVVRCLSGCFNRSVRDILPLGAKAPVRVYARVGALQETRTAPEDFLLEVAGKRCTAVLFCLAPSARAHEPELFPDAQAYVTQFKAAGWRIRSIAVLGQNAGGVRSPNLQQYIQAGITPINVTAQAVRAHFGWV
jgi:hypothetical protein